MPSVLGCLPELPSCNLSQRFHGDTAGNTARDRPGTDTGRASESETHTTSLKIVCKTQADSKTGQKRDSWPRAPVSVSPSMVLGLCPHSPCSQAVSGCCDGTSDMVFVRRGLDSRLLFLPGP